MVLSFAAVMSQLCHNACHNLSRFFGVCCETCWTEYQFKGALIKTLMDQFVVNPVSFPVTADHADASSLNYSTLNWSPPM